MFIVTAAFEADAQTVREYRLEPGASGLELKMRDIARPQPQAGEVLVRIRAVSLNHRDLSVAGRASSSGLVPLSDGAGEVIAVGPGVTQFAVGDRVAGTFFADWSGGPRTAQAMASARGGGVDGVLAEVIVSHEDGLIPVPDYLTFEEAATLPCAAVTAWRALFTDGALEPGETVLLEGTGGVSIFGLQLAAAAGARPIITSSSDAKLEQARALGAAGTVNYRSNPEWQEDVLALTDGVGVDHILEVVGQETMLRAIQALAYDGHIAVIGGLSGRAEALPLGSLPQGATVTNVFVGSREDFAAMNAFLVEHQLHPVIDRVFPFEEAAAAYAYMDSGAHMGKIVIRL
ncbi:MAG: NAD(P)-dependent alcohol dehydrogenase [Gammaproteobacteria bacterium]|nr:NAD(P)-dependent alcohol dehydrogenase [Gammaproteobacteria bacterium]MDH3506608.1 NAD(P)-dependent alcohol dehydrogenase [Gammaproteobacteria bacterium]